MLMHEILQNHLLCTFVAILKINAIYALYPESFCNKNFAIRKVFAFCDSAHQYLNDMHHHQQQHQNQHQQHYQQEQSNIITHQYQLISIIARNVKFYTCCDEPYLDITFNITMRRKTLFYTVLHIIITVSNGILELQMDHSYSGYLPSTVLVMYC